MFLAEVEFRVVGLQKNRMEVRRHGDENANEKEANLYRPGDGMLMLKLLITDDFSWDEKEIINRIM